MRILYLHQYFTTPQAPGGTRSFEFTRRLIANGHQVHVVSSAVSLPKEFQSIKKITNAEIEGIPITIVPVPYSNSMSFPERIHAFIRFAVLASLEATRHRSDVIYATSTPLTIVIPAIVGKLWQRIPMVFEVRDLWPELPIAVGALSNPLLRRAAYMLEWIAYHSAAHIVALSPGMAEGIRLRGIAEERITVIPNSCDIELFDIPTEAGDPYRTKLGLLPDQPLITYTGTFGLINDVGYLVDVAAAMCSIDPEIHFLLVGSGAERDKLTRQARELGILDQNLTIWDSLPKSEIPAIFAAATLTTSLFMPLREMWNNSANKFFDSLAAGKPIAINYGGWQADLLIEFGVGIVLPQQDTQQAAKVLADFVRDPVRLQGAAQVARQLAKTRFSRDNLAVQLEQVLERAYRWKSVP